MSLRDLGYFFAEICATALVCCSIGAIIIAYLLLTGNMP